MNRLILSLWLLLGAGLSLALSQTPPARTSVPRSRPLLLLAPFTGEKLVTRALSATVQGAVLQVELPDGSRSGYDKTALVTTLPWYPDADITAGTVDLGALGKLYDNAAREHPEFATGLFAEKARSRAVADAREKERGAKVTTVLSARYDPRAGYTVEELHARLHAADEAITLDPSRQTEISRAVAPFREHLAYLEAGKIFSDGQWLAPEEIRQRTTQAAAADRLRAFATNLEVPIETQILDPGQVNRIFLVGGGILALPILLGIVLFVRRKRLVGALLIVLPAAGGAVCITLLLATEIPWPASLDGTLADDVVVRALALSTTQEPSASPEDHRQVITESDLNAFLAKRTKLQGMPVADAINLREIAVAFRRGGITFCETAEWRGRILRIRQDDTFTQDAGRFIVTHGDVRVGNATVPEPLAGWLRAGLENSLGRFLQAHDPRATLASARFTDGILELVANAPTPLPQIAHATPTPAPAAAPIPHSAPFPHPKRDTGSDRSGGGGSEPGRER